MYPYQLSFGRKVDLSESVRDPTMLKRCQDDPLRVNSTGGLRPWLAFMQLMGNANPATGAGKAIPKIQVPLCVTHGLDDKAAGFFGAAHAYANSKTPPEHKVLRIFEHSTHNLFADPVREELFDRSAKMKDMVRERQDD